MTIDQNTVHWVSMLGNLWLLTMIHYQTSKLFYPKEEVVWVYYNATQ